nr:T9SS type A sorting domain-containing protein [Chryseobacterium gwangjuense]
MRKILLIGSFLSLAFTNAQTTNVYNYGFDTAFAVDWVLTNQSSPAGASIWSKATYTTPLSSAIFGSGNTTTVPVGQAGGNNSFALVNFNSTTGAGTISNWLITPAVSVKDGDVVSFYTRKGTDGTTDYPDRLELRYSVAGTTVNPSSGAADVGSFTNVGVTVNPTLVAGFVYPKTWTKYSFTISGIGGTPIPVKFGFRYYVTDGGPSGSNSDLIGIDTFSVDRSTLAVSDVASKKTSLSIFPNPTSDFVNIKTDSKINAVSVIDLTGRKLDVKFEGNRVNVRSLPAGTYILNIETDNGVSTEKIVKK